MHAVGGVRHLILIAKLEFGCREGFWIYCVDIPAAISLKEKDVQFRLEPREVMLTTSNLKYINTGESHARKAVRGYVVHEAAVWRAILVTEKDNSIANGVNSTWPRVNNI